MEELWNALRGMEAKYATSQAQLEVAKRERLILERKKFVNEMIYCRCPSDDIVGTETLTSSKASITSYQKKIAELEEENAKKSVVQSNLKASSGRLLEN